MTQLVKQPSVAPTRKMWAVIITAFVTGGARATLDLFPGMQGFEGVIDAAGPWIQGALIVAAGYFTRERAE